MLNKIRGGKVQNILKTGTRKSNKLSSKKINKSIKKKKSSKKNNK